MHLHDEHAGADAWVVIRVRGDGRHEVHARAVRRTEGHARAVKHAGQAVESVDQLRERSDIHADELQKIGRAIQQCLIVLQECTQFADGCAVLQRFGECFAKNGLDDRVEHFQRGLGYHTLRELHVDDAGQAARHAAVDLEDGEGVLRVRGHVLLRGQGLTGGDGGRLHLDAHIGFVDRERALGCVTAVVVRRGREARADLLVFTGADARRGVDGDATALDREPEFRGEFVRACVRQVAFGLIFDDHALGCVFLAHGGLRPVDELVEDLRAHGGGVLRVGDGHALLEHDLRLRARVGQRHGDDGFRAARGELHFIGARTDGRDLRSTGPAALEVDPIGFDETFVLLRHGHGRGVRIGQDGGDDGGAQRIEVDGAIRRVGDVDLIGLVRSLRCVGRFLRRVSRGGVRGLRRRIGRGISVRIRGLRQLRERVDLRRALQAHGVVLRGRLAVQRGIAHAEHIQRGEARLARRERGDDAGSGAGHGHPFGRAAGQRAGRFVLPFLRADIAVVAQQRLAEQVIDVRVVGDVGRTVVHVRHDVRGKGRDLERGELAEQQYGQQDRKDPCYVFVGCHCKKPPVCGL